MGYLQKLKWGQGLASGADFLHDFSVQIFVIKYSISWQSFPRYQTNCVIMFLLRLFLAS